MLWMAPGPVVLTLVWLGAILYLRRFSPWMILGGFAFCFVLVVLAIALTSAAGPAASWDGATAADRAGGRGFAADAAFVVLGNGMFALACWFGLTIITMIIFTVQGSTRDDGVRARRGAHRS
jgi:hypothetical protein